MEAGGVDLGAARTPHRLKPACVFPAAAHAPRVATLRTSRATYASQAHRSDSRAFLDSDECERRRFEVDWRAALEHKLREHILRSDAGAAKALAASPAASTAPTATAPVTAPGAATAVASSRPVSSRRFSSYMRSADDSAPSDNAAPASPPARGAAREDAQEGGCAAAGARSSSRCSLSLPERSGEVESEHREVLEVRDVLWERTAY